MPPSALTQILQPLIVADIGGTHARFARIDPAAAALLELRALDTSAYASFEAALAAYLADTGGAPGHALAIGAAGPLSAGRIALTNAHWILDPPAIARAFGLSAVMLANDLAAFAAGIAGAGFEALATITPAARAPEDIIVIAQGTGLGAAIIRRRGSSAEAFPTEAGHLSFAPETQEEDRLLAAMRKVHPRPTFEHVASGSGLPDVYAALNVDGPKIGASGPKDGAAVIDRANGGDAVAHAALRLATGALATFIRTLVLLNGGADAVVIGGGLGLALDRYWRDSGFLARVRHAPGVPLELGGLGFYLAPDPSLPLLGAAQLASGRVLCARLARFP
jgi:glucokinase